MLWRELLQQARREAEIAGLKEALQILESEAALIQKSARQLSMTLAQSWIGRMYVYSVCSQQ